jgi:coatomer protein complex subunit epsilon
MEADPLYHVKQLFYQGEPCACNAADASLVQGWVPAPTSLTAACIAEASQHTLTPPDAESLHRALYVARSHLASHPPQVTEAQAVLKPFLSLETPPPSAKAVSALASYLAGTDKEAKIEEVRDLVIECEGEGADDDAKDEERVVRVAAGTLFILERENEEAVATLTEGCAKTDLEW